MVGFLWSSLVGGKSSVASREPCTESGFRVRLSVGRAWLVWQDPGSFLAVRLFSALVLFLISVPHCHKTADVVNVFTAKDRVN